jgi:hypothetical protein
MCRERPDELGEYLVLNVFVRIPVPTFQFNTDGKVIATRPVLEPGCSRMPGPLVQGHVLGQAAVAPDEDVGGDPQPGDQYAFEPAADRIEAPRGTPISHVLGLASSYRAVCLPLSGRGSIEIPPSTLGHSSTALPIGGCGDIPREEDARRTEEKKAHKSDR